MCDDKSNDNSMRAIYCHVWRHLHESGGITSLVSEFSALELNSTRVECARRKIIEFGAFPNLVDNSKSLENALKFKEEGNKLFGRKKDKLAFLNYTKSIANAPEGSEYLGLAFANRSAVLFETGRYKECLKDISLAFSNNCPQRLYDKLTIRKRKCENLQVNQSSFVYHEPLPSLTSKHNNAIECSNDSIEIKYEKDLGRHIVATKDISVGDIIGLENPFCKILLKENYYTHCYECLQPSYNLIACNSCPLVMFCSEDCKRNAWNIYHKYECLILATLLNLGVNKLTLIAMKICMIVGDISKFNINSQIESTYKSQSYPEVHKLISNTNSRTVADLFERSITAAVIFQLVEKYGNFFNEGNSREDFKEMLLLHMQTGPSNFHEISELVERDSGVYELDEIGAGVYGFLSLLNHSCNPNVVRHCYGSCIVLRALRPVSRGEQLFDNYGYHHALMTKKDRQEHLMSQYYFECQCEACTKNWPLYKNLPEINVNLGITDDSIAKLMNGSKEVASSSISNLEELARRLEVSRPSKELAHVQEILKQCYAILANRSSKF